MASLLDDVVREKQALSDELIDYRNRLIAKAYAMLSEDTPLMRMARELRRTPVGRDIREYAAPVLNEVYRAAKEAKRAAPARKKGDEDVSIPVFDWFERKHIAQRVSRNAIYPSANSFEAKRKTALIEYLMGQEVGDGEKPVFFLVSSHGDCAQDHADYQGRLYYDRFWRRKVSGKAERKEINSIISSQGLRSFQWVTGKPVWMITRPNCRHYFVGVTASEARKGADFLLDEYGMRSAVGKRGNKQTLRHSTSKGWYTESNVRSILKQYEDRLALHERMYASRPNESVRRAIEKDRLLVKKWRYYLRNHDFGG